MEKMVLAKSYRVQENIASLLAGIPITNQTILYILPGMSQRGILVE